MSGDRFSLLYLRPDDAVSDSSRARYRIGTLFSEAIFDSHSEHLAAYLGRNLGVPLPGNGQYPSQFHQFVRECRTSDFLDIVSIVYRYLFWHVNESAANWWRDVVREIFSEENLAYEIDQAGGAHPRVDRSRVSKKRSFGNRWAPIRTVY
jgi:hypothetical protein